MYRKWLVWGSLLLLLLLMTIGPGMAEGTALPGISGAAPETPAPLPDGAEEQDARDITMACGLNGYWDHQAMEKIRDGKPRTIWESKPVNSEHSLTVEAPEGEIIGALLLSWRTFPVAVDIQEWNETTETWETKLTGDADFNAQYIPIPGMTKIKIVAHEGAYTPLKLCEIRVMTPGKLPEDFQIWKKPEGQADLMLIHAHPDDEVLWFGGVLPLYAGEMGKNVVVVTGTFSSYDRRIELLDCLWACGVRNYPVFLGYEDVYTSSLNTMYRSWKRQRVTDDLAELYRQYRPKVVVLHDLNGEYGHGAHRALSDCGMRAVAVAADPDSLPDSAWNVGTWDVPKVYVHLWKENPIRMDWHVPLERFGGKTALEAAQDAFQFHRSQVQKGYWLVTDGGLYDNSLFGLYHTTVGLDTGKGDFFEHISGEETYAAGFVVRDEADK